MTRTFLVAVSYDDGVPPDPLQDASEIEDALEKAGIQVRKIDLTQFPNSHKYFDDAVYEDFFAAIDLPLRFSSRWS
mgnify:CR=1 FL=1